MQFNKALCELKKVRENILDEPESKSEQESRIDLINLCKEITAEFFCDIEEPDLAYSDDSCYEYEEDIKENYHDFEGDGLGYCYVYDEDADEYYSDDEEEVEY